MFSLIITVAALVLVAVLVIATLFIGGDESFTKGKDEALATQAVAELNQIRSAIFAHHANEGHPPADLDDLVPKYLTIMPKGWGSTVPVGPSSLPVTSRVINSGDTDRDLLICGIINERFGHDSTPQCDEIASDFMGCCEAP